MGWTVLYIAFGFVALWLLGEVLLQYKARLRWRLVAFCGFLGVVVGVLLPSVPVIALGAVAFATGQTFVTLSFRRGFSTGWALGGKPGTSRRRRDPRPEDAEGEAGAAPPPPPTAPGGEPEGDFATAEFPRQDFGGEQGFDADPRPGNDHGFAGERGFEGERFGAEQDPGAERGPAGEEFARDTPGGGEYGDFPGQDAGPRDEYIAPAHAAAYGNGYGDVYRDPAAETAYTEPYPGAYQDNYAGATGYSEQGQYLAGGTDGYGYQTGWADQAGSPQGAGADGYGGDPAAAGGWPAGGSADASYYQETPPGGVWVPQQRGGVADDPLGYGYPQQPAADPYGQQPGYDPSRQGGYYPNEGHYDGR
ncbi:hypothetical protein SAMN06297387_101289 [Streptomyces zhaozhouensis]|uniref:Uncharacterized protein n=1 Tax=Streptomyces zhaozhouensis TaxID=1300267 RepID=A0A286DIY9_9ACTN|nr:hypothetical protein [Streptomyces zhaozhouensis]SOD58717.1 hypothetical protein SAMN06297387_101289 [Streptomyces zhaozhouensis]